MQVDALEPRRLMAVDPINREFAGTADADEITVYIINDEMTVVVNGFATHKHAPRALFIYANGGDDLITVNHDGKRNSTSVKVFGAAGNDTILSSSGRERLVGGPGDDLIIGGRGEDTIFGDEGNDSIRGNGQDDIISGGDGSDTIRGDEGEDFIAGAAKTDLLVGGEGNDTMTGGTSGDLIFGQEGDDSISGELGKDQLFGGDGDDVLTGGSERDEFAGQRGSDSFTDNTLDEPIDFNLGEDRIRFDDNPKIGAGSVSVSGAGKLDLTDNKLIVEGASSTSAVSSVVQSGGSDGSWNSPGIVTSLVDATSSSTSLGVAMAGEIGGSGSYLFDDSTLVMYTWGGDANLDGVVDDNDYFIIDQMASGNFDGGDFDHNRRIDGDDYFLIDGAFAFRDTGIPLATWAGQG